MDSSLLFGIFLAAAGFFLLLQGLRLLLPLLQMRRLRFRGAPAHVQIEREAVPPAERRLLESVADELQALGFDYRQTWRAESVAVLGEARYRYFELYLHAEHAVFAQVVINDLPEPGRAVNCIFSTATAERRYLTTNRCLHQHFPYPPLYRVLDAAADSVTAAFAFHLQSLPDAPRQSRLPEASDLLAQEAAYFAHWESIGWFEHQGDDWRLSLKGAWRFLHQLMAGNRRMAKLPPMKSWEPAEIRVLADRLAWAVQESNQRSLAMPLREKYFWFALSGALGMAAFAWMTSWRSAGFLMLVLLFHEFGHALMMRFLGYKQLGVVVIPFLGALAIGRKDDAGPWQRLLVLLAGPLPGLLLAAWLIWQGYPQRGLPDWGLELLIMLLVVNAFNLLPLTPLDGGQIVDTFVFARRPRWRFGFFVLSTLGLVLLGYFLQSPYLAGAGLLLGFSVPHAWRAIALERGLPQGMDADAALDAVLQKLHSGPACLPFVQRLLQVRRLLPILRARAPRWPESLAGLLIYLAVIAVPITVLFSSSIFQSFWVQQFQSNAASRPVPPAQPDWQAELATAAPGLPRWDVLFRAGAWFEENDQEGEAGARYAEALAELATLPADDSQAHLPRLDTRIALARVTGDSARYLELLPELRQLPPGERQRLAEVLENLIWLQDKSSPVRMAYFEEAVRVREALPTAAHDYVLAQDRIELARLYDEQGKGAEAEQLLQAAPFGDGLGAAHLRVPHVWFLLAHGRAGEAAKIASGSDFPSRDVVEAKLWALHLAGETQAAQAALTSQLNKTRQRKYADEAGVMTLLVDHVIMHAQTPEREAFWLSEAAAQREKLGENFRYLRSRIRGNAESAAWESLRDQARLKVLDRLPSAEQDKRDEALCN